MRSCISLALIAGLLAAQASHAAFTYPGCADAAESQFRYVPVIGYRDPVNVGSAIRKPLAVDSGMLEPLHIAFDAREDGSADIYYIEKRGTVKRYDAVAKTVTLVGALAGHATGGEMGLTGIALDPAFKANRRMYLYYAQGSPAEFRLGRFTLDAAGKLDNASQKILLRFRRNGENHTGGAMAFDDHGELWIAVGKNAKDYPNSYHETSENLSTEATSANLADFRGGILRIHPDDSPRGYSIPEGNFGPFWSRRFRSEGKTSLAAEYADTAKVRPEIYVKGVRNPYTLAVHPTRRWLAWGEFGVNTRDTHTEEHNLVTRPAFGGYPYFAGGFGTGNGTGYYPLWSGAGSGQYQAAHPGLVQDIAGPVNASAWNKGPRQLPPVTPALHTYVHGTQAGAVTGPIYRYDAASRSPFKWPPHFDGAWFLTDWVQGSGNNGFKGAKIYKLDSAGEAKVDSAHWFRDLDWYEPISFDQGPDGALYVVMYHGWHSSTSGTHIGRLEYTGTCRPDPSAHLARQPAGEAGLVADARSIRITRKGPSRLELRDLRGSLLFRDEQDGPREHVLGPLLAGSRGVHLAILIFPSGRVSRRVFAP